MCDYQDDSGYKLLYLKVKVAEGVPLIPSKVLVVSQPDSVHKLITRV